MAESMGIFSCLTLLCVCLLFLSFFLSSGCLAGAARSGSACCCAKWRPAARWVWSSVFLCRFFFFPPSPPLPLPHSCLGCGSAANRGGDWGRRGRRALRASNRRPRREARRAPIGWRWHHPAAGAAAAGQGRRCRGRLVQREKTGAMIPTRGRTARAGDPRRKGKREKASASLSLAGPGGEERGKRESERERSGLRLFL